MNSNPRTKTVACDEMGHYLLDFIKDGLIEHPNVMGVNENMDGRLSVEWEDGSVTVVLAAHIYND
jgi:hypothetical protein